MAEPPITNADRVLEYLAECGGDAPTGDIKAALRERTGMTGGTVANELSKLKDRGYATNAVFGRWTLTGEGWGQLRSPQPDKLIGGVGAVGEPQLFDELPAQSEEAVGSHIPGAGRDVLHITFTFEGEAIHRIAFSVRDLPGALVERRLELGVSQG